MQSAGKGFSSSFSSRARFNPPGDGLGSNTFTGRRGCRGDGADTTLCGVRATLADRIVEGGGISVGTGMLRFAAVLATVSGVVVADAICRCSLATFFSSFDFSLYTSRTLSSASSTSCTFRVRAASSSAQSATFENQVKDRSPITRSWRSWRAVASSEVDGPEDTEASSRFCSVVFSPCSCATSF